jgi:hypothetical protein
VSPDAGSSANAANGSPQPQVDANTTLALELRVEPTDCGHCYQLEASVSGGSAPYEVTWEDGSRSSRRRVCVQAAAASISVVARDALGARSVRTTAVLQELEDASCPEPPPLLCVENPSFEGKPAPNFGSPAEFDAAPWSACTQAAGTTNTPDIANDTIPQNIVMVPKATDGSTFLALGEDEQASQALCQTIQGGTTLYVELDLARMNVNAGVAPETERVFLEMWGGVAADCSQRELLWASAALQVGWKHHCVTLRPQAFMDQLTLRASTDKSLLSPAYLLVDHIVPVERCP